MSDWPLGYDRLILDEVDSTSTRAAMLEAAAPTWVFARKQTAAKGRRGRAWSMPDGNFAASLVWSPGGAPGDLALRSFVASLALYDALDGFGVRGLSLKWPNDVLLAPSRGAPGKLAGILLETAGQGRLVLGIGINLAAAPGRDDVEPGAVTPVSVREACGMSITPEAMLDALGTTFARREAEFTTWGFAPIRTAWLRHASHLGQPITARTVAETIPGIFETVDEDGQLVLQTPDGRRRIAAGDVFFGG